MRTIPDTYTPNLHRPRNPSDLVVISTPRNTYTALLLLTLLSACVSTPPTPIGNDTYYSQKSTAGGEFGNTDAAAGHLMVEGNKFCAAKGLEFQLLTKTLSPSGPSQPIGGASITFKCVAHSTDPTK
jgi:hypothetical protein